MLNLIIKISSIVFFLFVSLQSWAKEELPAKALPPHKSNVLIVGFTDGTNENDKAAIRASLNSLKHSKLSKLAKDTEIVLLPKGTSISDAIKKIASNPHVKFVEPDYILEANAAPNDPYYTNGSQWNMYSNVSSPSSLFGNRAADAWAQGNTGSKDVIVGVIDSGIQLDHPDLEANIWVNPYEMPNNGIDDDGNGYIDDVNGYDFGEIDNIPAANGNFHGTFVAGIIGAVGSNALGVVGMNWDVSLISLKIADSSGTFFMSRAIQALDYLTDLKIRHPELNIVASNNSYGGLNNFSQSFLDAINRAGDQGIFFINGSGNDTINIDQTARYPSNYQCTNGGTRGYDCVIVVAAMNQAGALAPFANYGSANVDLGAPGVTIWSTTLNSSYTSGYGGSFAAPQVTGALALCKAAALSVGNPITPKQMIAALLYSTNPVTGLQTKTLTGGELDAGRLNTYCKQLDFTTAPCTPPTAPSNVSATVSGSVVSLVWSDNSTGEWKFEVKRETYNKGTNSYGNPVIVAQPAANTTSYQDSSASKGTYRYSVRAFNTNSLTGTCYSTYSAPSNQVILKR